MAGLLRTHTHTHTVWHSSVESPWAVICMCWTLAVLIDLINLFLVVALFAVLENCPVKQNKKMIAILIAREQKDDCFHDKYWYWFCRSVGPLPVASLNAYSEHFYISEIKTVLCENWIVNVFDCLWFRGWIRAVSVSNSLNKRRCRLKPRNDRKSLPWPRREPGTGDPQTSRPLSHRVLCLSEVGIGLVRDCCLRFH